MALTPPATLSPSKISSFSDCALALDVQEDDIITWVPRV